MLLRRHRRRLLLLWLLIRHHLVSNIKTKGRPELKALRRAGESFETWLAVTPEDLLLRWINHHLKKYRLAQDGEPVAFEGLAEVSCVSLHLAHMV